MSSSILCAPGCVVSAIKCVTLCCPSQWIIKSSPLPQDRRPLAPAAVAKMVVRRDDDSIVDVESVTPKLFSLNFELLTQQPSEVDCSFFLVTVDLWSADGKQETNLVLHPSSADRYVPAHSSSKSKRRGTSFSEPVNRVSGNQTSAGGRSTPTPHYRPGDQV
jgi:hypothetical protein